MSIQLKWNTDEGITDSEIYLGNWWRIVQTPGRDYYLVNLYVDDGKGWFSIKFLGFAKTVEDGIEIAEENFNIWTRQFIYSC